MKVIILAGGKGTRLWPLSREKYAKQFLKLFYDTSLIDMTYKRALGFAKAEDIITITNKDYYLYVKEVCDTISPLLSKNIIVEPVGKNTAPAIALSVLYAVEKMKKPLDEVFVVFTSDHVIEPSEELVKYILQAQRVALMDYLVTFGIKPNRPDTGFGYIKLGKRTGDFYLAERFIEKPDFATAKEYLDEGGYLWNSGIFAFKAGIFFNELKNHTPTIYEFVEKGFDFMLNNFSCLPSNSIDYAIMESSKRVAVIPVEIFWSDIGSWDSLYEIMEHDNNGNVLIGDVEAIDVENSLIYSTERLVSIAGVKDLTVVETDDAILVMKRGDAQKIKDLLEILKAKGKKELVEHREVYRPWGSFKNLRSGDRYKIKSVVVKPGESLSLQMHHHRSEHWIVVRGTAKVTIGEKTFFVHEGESTYVPKATVHRLSNSEKVPLEIIEVQFGEYVEEDDIVRLEDRYGRLEK